MKERSFLNIRKQAIGESALYFLIWMLVLLVPFMNSGMMSDTTLDINSSLLSWLKVLPFYLLFILNNYLLYPHLWGKRRYWIYLAVTTILIAGIFTLLEIYDKSDITVIFPTDDESVPYKTLHIGLTVFPWWGNMIAAVLMLVANNSVRTLYRQMQTDEDTERLQRQNLQAEMYYLKHQINPHFLMNTLNNIHALVDIDGEAAKQAVIQLSDMMRYVVYDTGGDAISLKEEVRFIENYIELMRIRYTDDVKIQYNKPLQLKGRTDIPPLIFIVFVENAFKHGVSYDYASYINIDIECAEGYVVGRFENSVNPKKRTEQHGIGLENVRKRLDLIYDDRYDLQIDESSDSYCITLKIPILENNEVHRH